MHKEYVKRNLSHARALFPLLNALKVIVDAIDKTCDKCLEELSKQHNIDASIAYEKFCKNCIINRLMELLDKIPFNELFKLRDEIT